MTLDRVQRTNAIRDKAKGRWRQILVDAGVPDQLLTRHLGPCPVCGGSTRFRFDDKYGYGNWVCHHCDRKPNGLCGAGDGFRLLELFSGWSFKQAVDFVEEWLGGTASPLPPMPMPSVPSRAEEIAKALEKSKRIWHESKEVQEGSPVALYLQSRGIFLATYSKALRVHPGLDYFILENPKEMKSKYKKLGKFPAMVAALQHPDGRFAGVHVTYLTEDGQKAPVTELANNGVDYPIRKLMAKGAEGSAIRLLKPGPCLGVAEGIETAYSAHLLTGKPVWPTTSAGLLQDFVVPVGVSFVEIFVDADKPDQHGVQRGQRSAKILMERLKNEGIASRIRIPTKLGMDFNDLLQIHNRNKVVNA